MQRLWRIEKHDEDDDGTHLGALISWDWLDEPDWLQRRALKKVEAREKKLAKKIGSALSPYQIQTALNGVTCMFPMSFKLVLAGETWPKSWFFPEPKIRFPRAELHYIVARFGGYPKSVVTQPVELDLDESRCKRAVLDAAFSCFRLAAVMEAALSFRYQGKQLSLAPDEQSIVRLDHPPEACSSCSEPFAVVNSHRK